MKIVTIIGARPQFIKAAAVSRKIREENQEIIIHTGQHYDDNMSKIFFEELDIPYPDYNLNVGSGGHGAQTGRMLEKIEEILEKECPDWILVYGDTNSTIAGALAASKMLIPVAHVEAGLRSFNMNMPEEQNRILTDHISKLLFAPTETSVSNLRNEGIKEEIIHNVGDVMYDATLHFEKIANEKSIIMEKLEINEGDYILATVHRAENTNDISRLRNIIEALNSCQMNIIFPLHPRTKKYIEDYNLKLKENIRVIEPVGYLDMIMLEKNSKKIVTDSGGVQKEAFFFNKPCITLRDETEWVETVNNGWNILVGANESKILNAIQNFSPTNDRENYYGDGDAAHKIVSKLRGWR